MDKLKEKLLNDITYSYRRYFVDRFFFDNMFSLDGKTYSVIDVGGKRNNKRGMFNISDLDLDVKYLNIDKTTDPDFHCDSSNIPVGNESFDLVILSEVLEHLENPVLTLKEAFRVLKKGGKLYICTPFMFHIHADPHDYARYTGFWYESNLKKIGFHRIRIDKQGLFFSVLANQMKLIINELLKADKIKIKIVRKFLFYFLKWLIKKSFVWDESHFVTTNSILSNTTTGYGVVCEK